MSEAAVAVAPVTFFSWGGWDDHKKKMYPSSMVINISGGETRVANDGSKVRNPNKTAAFHNGTFTTDDPEIIAAIRKLSSQPGSNITEDREVYYQNVMGGEEKAKRAQNLLRQKDEVIEETKRENSRLKQLLEQKSQETPARRREA
jgi:hypothetical protein